MQLPDAAHSASPAELQERLRAEQQQCPFLLYRDGDDAQRIVSLDAAPERLTIGRSSTNDVALTWDGEVSRVHATLERLGDEWTLVDDGRSRNGSFIHGLRVLGRTRLQDGDAIRLGRTVLVFRFPRARESLRTATSQQRIVPLITDAQRRVLVELCRPYSAGAYAVPASNRQIADALMIGIETVKTHMRALFEAFALTHLPQHHKRTTLAQRALEAGIVAPHELDA